MKSFVFLLLIATIACISVIHSAPVSLTRNNHRVDQPLGFLTNFILNKRARVVQTPVVVSEGKKRAVDSGASTSPRYTNTYWKSIKPKTLAHSVKTDSNDAGKSKPVIDLLLFGDLTNRNQRTAEVTAAEAILEELSSASDLVEAPVVEIVEIKAEEIPPAEVETPVVELVEIVQIAEAVAAPETVAVATAEASSAATDASATVSAATSSAVSETVEKESPAKAIEVPVTSSKKVVYVDNTRDFRVTLEVIKVEFDPVYHHESTVETVSESSNAVEKAPVASVEASAGASTSISTGDSASATAVTEAAAVSIPVDLVILIETDGVSSAAEVAPAAVDSISSVDAIPGVDSAPVTVVATPVVSASATAVEAPATAVENYSGTAVEASATAVSASATAVAAPATADVEASAIVVEASAIAVAAPATVIAIPVVEVPVPSVVDSAAPYVRPGVTPEAPAVGASDAATKTGGVEGTKGSASSGGGAEGKGKGGRYWETGGDSDSEED
ncbi:fibrous sheath CABYR-binding protein-like [Daphnia pulex]|uniref:fibrous sheath CABYR-binding protein-like n=1 Tax=Daphnia pulex TaxID=6669 RepID=UPI001EDCE5F0|nr:fibrous sheath CABYR-binding protein-like [Daphnia pulex]